MKLLEPEDIKKNIKRLIRQKECLDIANKDFVSEKDKIELKQIYDFQIEKLTEMWKKYNENMNYEYEIFLQSEVKDLIKFDGWYPIQTVFIPNGNIDYFIKKGTIRKIEKNETR